MKERCFKWIFSAPGDHAGLCQRLNRLAADGWELDWDGDGNALLAQFIRTERTELIYNTEPAPLLRDAGQLEAAVEQHRQAGWEPVGTINGVDVYCSMPCRAPQAMANLTDHHRVYGSGILTLLAFAAGVILCWSWQWFGAQWYSSNLSVFLYLSRFIYTAAAVYWGLWTLFHLIRPVKKPPRAAWFWFRSVLLAGQYLWWILALSSVVLTLLPIGWALGLLVIGIAATVLLRAWHWNVSRVLLAGCILLAALGLHPFFPDVHLYSEGSAAWRSGLTGIVQAETLGEGEKTLLSVEYEESGSLLAQKRAYQESREGLQIKCEHYSCATAALAALIKQELETQNPDSCIVSQGRSVMLLEVSGDYSRPELEAIALEQLENQ